MSDTFLLVGLGNPGTRYARTRHNAGHMVLEGIAATTGSAFRSARRGRAEVIEGHLGEPGRTVRTILARTTCFMNESGSPVSQLAAFYGIDPEHVVVVHDDVDLPFGEVRLKRGGGEGGHNGLRDISSALGTKDYLRVRVGVGRPPGRQDTADHVLAPFSAAERAELPAVLDRAAEASEAVILEGLTAAQQRFHGQGAR